MMLRRYILLVLTSVCLVSCSVSGPSRTCDEITGRGLRNQMQQSQSPEDMRSQIARSFGLPLDQIFVDPYKNLTTFRWIKDGVEGNMTMEETHPYRVGFYYRERLPSADAVIKCFGTPDRYRAYYQSPPPGGSENLFTFDMFFIQQGVVAGGGEYKRGKEPPRLDGNTSVDGFLFVPIDSLEDTMERLSQGLTTEMRQQIKPWPGTWKSLVIDIEPYLREQ